MNSWTMRLSCALLAMGAVANADVGAKKHAHKADSSNQAVFIEAKDIKWTAAPPDLPKGAEMTVLGGDPTKPGMFTVRLKMPDGYKIPPHWHSKAENLTVLSGTLRLYMGDTMTSEPHDLGAGDYHSIPAKTHHAAEARGEAIVQLHGNGPFDIHYLNREDNPNPSTARR